MKTHLESGVQCNIANLPPLKLLPAANREDIQDDRHKQHELLPDDEPFEDLDVDDEDYNPFLESEEDDDEKELTKFER